MVKVVVFVEGGIKGQSEQVNALCRQGFSNYIARVIPTGPKPRVSSCGSRGKAYKDFLVAVRRKEANCVNVLLVDSEAPVDSTHSPVEHLEARDNWSFPVPATNKVFLMVQAMEAWFLADRQTLAAFYGNGFRANSLPRDERTVESIPKDDLEPSLINATRATRTKGTYHKTNHAFEILGRIDPSKVEAGSPHAKSFHDFLRSL